MAILTPITGTIANKLASGGIHVALLLKKTTGSGLHHGHEMKRSQQSVVLRLLSRRQYSVVRLPRQLIQTLLIESISPQRSNLSCRLRSQTFSKRLDQPVKDCSTHKWILSQRLG